jgi:hypothetical protein
VAGWDPEAKSQYTSQSFLPSGVFAERPEDIEARAFLTGIVERVSALTNEATGGNFVHALVTTYGATIDSVFAPSDIPSGLSAGNVVQGTFWLIGRLLPSA